MLSESMITAMNVAIAQSGGPTCAINASLVGAFTAAASHPEVDRIFGAENGIEGIMEDRLVDLTERLSRPAELMLLRRTPSTALGSCRCRLPDLNEDDAPYRAILECFQKHSIQMFFYIGGNDSMDTAAKLSAYLARQGSSIQVLGIPKTIDNDLCETDHTPGFGSAAKYVAATLSEIACDSVVYSIPSVTIAEIMGRDSGWLAASSCVLRTTGCGVPHLIYLPEMPFSEERFLDDLRRKLTEEKHVVVALSEGIPLPAASACQSGVSDAFGHSYLAGIGKYLEGVVRRELGCKTRSIELNVMQRCASHISSLTDLQEAEQVAAAAVEAAFRGETGRMMCIKRLSSTPYAVTFESVPASLTANRTRYFPKEWITPDGCDVTEDALNYFLPLIQGEYPPILQNGMPLHWTL